MRLVVFQNKDLNPPPDSPLLFSYAMGVTHVLTGLDVTVLFHIVHTIVLALIILSFYRLGRFHSTAAGIILAVLITLYFAPSFYLGTQTMVPSLFMFLVLPNLFLALLRSRYILTFVWFTFLVFVYWWAAAPFTLAIVLFLILRDGKKRWLLLPILLLVAYISSYLPFYKSALGLFSYSFPDWYYDRFITILAVYFLAAVGFVVVLFTHDDRIKKLGHLSLTLVGTNLLFWVGISTYAHVRTVLFLWIGIFILIALFFVEIRRYISKFALLLVIMLFFAPLAGTVAVTSIKDALEGGGGNITTFPSEQEVFRWLGVQGGKPLVVSDYPSMLITTFYLPTANAVLFSRGETSPEFRITTADGHTLDGPAIYDMLARKDFVPADFLLLSSIAESSGANAVYLLISPRTREELNYFIRNRHIHGKLLVQKDYLTALPQLSGENKFREDKRFEQVYDFGGVQVYYYSP